MLLNFSWCEKKFPQARTIGIHVNLSQQWLLTFKIFLSDNSEGSLP